MFNMWLTDSNHRSLPADGYDDDWYAHHSTHVHHVYNNTITSTVYIRVTPRENYFVSWGILWSGFALASIVALIQARMEQRLLRQKQADGDADSTAEMTRIFFRRMLIAAMLARMLAIPVQIWPDPIWYQFFGDSFPEALFAIAWSLLVVFFVQLVGVALGIGFNTTPGIVIQSTAFCIYTLLLLLQIWNSVASVLLYALFCCIYGALFGVVLSFCPRLYFLLRRVQHASTNQSSKDVQVRLVLCTFVCLALFATHTIHYARRVIAPPGTIYWWFNYGCLELLPSCIILWTTHPHPVTSETSSVPSTPTLRRGLRRVDSGGSQSTGGLTRILKASPETTPLKSAGSYGSADPV